MIFTNNKKQTYYLKYKTENDTNKTYARLNHPNNLWDTPDIKIIAQKKKL